MLRIYLSHQLENSIGIAINCCKLTKIIFKNNYTLKKIKFIFKTLPHDSVGSFIGVKLVTLNNNNIYR